MPDPKTFTRQELYEFVWSEPVVKLAERFGLSDVGFAKACKSANIPRPPRGYWAKLEAGKKVKRQPLPERGLGCQAALILAEPITHEIQIAVPRKKF